MNLEPVATQPGAWINPRWREGLPGTFAVVIGVSSYDHLDGSERSFELDQLEVSALTAFRIFQWLGDEYFVEGCPIALCWLLLSPTEAECAFEPRIVTHRLLPTFENCEHAIGWWATQMKEMPSTAAAASRGLFFFSGHGFEMTGERQVLLPSDYLRPPLRNPNKAISSTNLWQGLASSRVSQQLFFLDACRNAPPLLRKTKVVGMDILPEENNESAIPEYYAPVLYATSSGQRAFQHPAPDQGISLFGQALLDGFAGKPDLDLKQSAKCLLVKMYDLHEFMQTRVRDQLINAHEPARQPVMLGGRVNNPVVTELPAHFEVSARKHVVIPPGGTPLQLVESQASASETLIKAALTEPLSFGVPRERWSQDDDLTHDVFGSESAGWIWMHGLQLVRLSDGRVIADPNAVTVHLVQHDRPPRDERLGYWRVELTIEDEDPLGYCLGLKDRDGSVWTTVLPRIEEVARPRYEIEFELDRKATFGPRSLIRLESSLAYPTDGSTRLVGDIWRMYRFSNLDWSLEAFGELLRMHRRDLQSASFSPVLAGLIGLRLGSADLSQKFSEVVHSSLTSHDRATGWAPAWTADATAMVISLIAQQCGSKGDEVDGADFGHIMRTVGIPRTCLGVIVGRDAIRRLLGCATKLPPEKVSSLRVANYTLSIAANALTGHGLFASYADIPPEEVANAFGSIDAGKAYKHERTAGFYFVSARDKPKDAFECMRAAMLALESRQRQHQMVDDGDETSAAADSSHQESGEDSAAEFEAWSLAVQLALDAAQEEPELSGQENVTPDAGEATSDETTADKKGGRSEY